jgi:hypothetical protein
MTDDDNAFEQARAESDDFVEWTAEIDPGLAVPLSTERFVVDRVRLEDGLRARLTPAQLADWNAGRHRYRWGGFDSPQGWGWVEVLDQDGGRVLGLRVHWSTIAAG